MGSDSNGSGIVGLLEIARLFSLLYSNPKTRGRYNLLFGLTSGGPYNYNGTQKVLISSQLIIIFIILKFFCLSINVILLSFFFGGPLILIFYLLQWLRSFDQRLRESIDYAICLNSIGSWDNELWIHVSKPAENVYIKQIFEVSYFSFTKIKF